MLVCSLLLSIVHRFCRLTWGATPEPCILCGCPSVFGACHDTVGCSVSPLRFFNDALFKLTCVILGFSVFFHAVPREFQCQQSFSKCDPELFRHPKQLPPFIPLFLRCVCVVTVRFIIHMKCTVAHRPGLSAWFVRDSGVCFIQASPFCVCFLSFVMV